MANGYIGKISAVVTANTSDLSRKLSGAVGDVDKFANRIASSIERSSKSAADSLNNIFTPLQRLQRNIQAGLAGNVFRRDNVEQYIRSVQQAVSISEQLGKPLSSGASQFQKLTLEVQGAFLPALNRAQTAVINLSTTLQQQGSISERSFGQVEGVINRTTQAIQRLTQAQQLASQSLTGNELQFGNPRLFETLSANARTTQRAAALPASALVDGDIARQIRALDQYQKAAVEAAGRVESLRLEPNVNPEVLLAAERRLISIIETARRAGREVQTSVANAQGLFTVANVRPESAGLGLFGTQAGTAEQRALAKARELSAEFAKLPESAQQGLSGLAGIAANLANRVDQGKASAEQLETVLARLQARIEAASPAAAIARANQQLVIAPDQPPPPPPRTDLGNRLAEQGRRRVQGLTGDINIDSSDRFGGQAQRDIDALASRVGAVRQQLETLPNVLRVQFIPALQQAQQQLIALQNSPGATAREIENAAFAVARLERNARSASAALNFRQSFGGGGIEGIESQLNERALQGYSAQLGILQQALGRVSAEARGPALQSFARLRDTIADAMARGTLETTATREQIRRLTNDAVAATAAVAGVSQGALGRQVRRAGDVGRLGFGNTSLAINQLVFAVDDFFSVTGGAEQRIRALGNNITQFGFIVGGTAGLVAGLAAVLVAQGIVAFIRYSNGGATAADQTKALSDALQRQRTLVDELAQSFESLADSLTTGLFSKARQDLEEFRKEIRQLVQQQRAARDERVVATSPGVAQEQSIQARFDREIQAETNLARRQALERQRREAADVERRLGERIRNAPAPSGEQLQQIVQQRVDFLSDFTRRSNRGPSPRLNLIRRAAEQIPAGEGVADRQQQLAQLNEILGVLKPVAAETFLGFRTLGARAVENTVNILEQQAALVERELSKAIDVEAVRSLETTRTTAIQLARNIETLEEAVAANVAGAAEALSRAEDIGAALQEARDRLVNAQKGVDADGNPLGGVVERAAAVKAAQADLTALQEAAKQRQSEIAAIDSTRRSLETFAAALDRVADQLTNTLAQEARSAADRARRAANREQGILGARLGGRPEDAEFARRRRAELEQEARAAELQASQRQAASLRARNQFERDAAAGNLGEEARQLIARRNAAQAVLDDRASGGDARREAEAEILEAGVRLQQIFEQSGVAKAAAAAADGLDAVAAAANRRRELADRGRELMLGDGRQIGRDLAQDIAALQEARREQFEDPVVDPKLLRGILEPTERRLAEIAAQFAAAGVPLTPDVLVDLPGRAPIKLGDVQAAIKPAQEFLAAINRVTDERLRQAAPTIFGFADQVQNALIQGPSRAALQATDVSTVEGARELNRLLRGEDSARDQPLVGLQEEANRLLKVIAEAQAQVAN